MHTIEGLQFISHVRGSVKWEKEVDLVQQLSLEEGNDAISHDKFNVRTTPGWTILARYNGEPAGMVHLEPSWYTGDSDIAVRACRYHILKKFRNKQIGFPLLDRCQKIATREGYKVLYITHHTENKALNALYQKKRTVPGHSKEPYSSEGFTALTLHDKYLFIVDPENAPNFKQYIYWIALEKGFQWEPKSNVEKYNEV